MRLTDLAKACDIEANCTVDPTLYKLLTEAATVLRSVRFHGGVCRTCLIRPAEVEGSCRPCYQHDRRADLAGANVAQDWLDAAADPAAPIEVTD